jgi:hypothetical protein
MDNTGDVPGGTSTSDPPLAVAGLGNNACFTQNQGNEISCFDSSVLSPTVQSISAGLTPMNIAMMTTGSSQLSAIFLNAGDGTLAVSPVPLQSSAVPLAHLPGMTTAQNAQTRTSGGTSLVILGYDTTQTPPLPVLQTRIAAVVSRFDKLIWLADVHNQATPTILGQFTLQGDPYRLAVDTTNHTFVVAMIDYLTDGSGGVTTRFVRIDATGAQTQLNATAPFVASGLAVSPNGQKIIACGEAQCLQIQNN